MTNEEIGELIGVHYSTVSRLRHGDRMPSGELLAKIVRVFRLDLNEAFDAFEHGPIAFAPYFQSHIADKSKSDFPWLSDEIEIVEPLPELPQADSGSDDH